MKVVVGLGNPGKRYRHTPHNAGFDAVDALADELGLSWRRSLRFAARTAGGRIGSQRLVLVKPQTYMNRSGSAVASVLGYWRAEVSDLVVVVDDAELELGRLRVRARGGSGGHNGLSSVIASVGGENFCRVRVGIGRGHNGEDLVRHVLSAPPAAQRSALEQACRRAADALKTVLETGVEAAMNEFNGPKNETDEERATGRQA